MNKQELVEEIRKRAPWYQRIEFPEYGISTTDAEEWAIYDGAPDNTLGNISPEEAARYRPQPKWKYLRDIIPSVKGLEVMEVGCANGFFSFEFARMGAAHVYGIDHSYRIKNAYFAKDALGLKNVTLINEDFFKMGFKNSPIPHEQDQDNVNSWLPNVDIIFLSSALTHFYYPFLALHKLSKLSRQYLIIDEGYYSTFHSGKESILKFHWEEKSISHSFVFSHRLLVKYLWRIGISPSNVKFHLYPVDKPERCCMIINLQADQTIINETDRKAWANK